MSKRKDEQISDIYREWLRNRTQHCIRTYIDRVIKLNEYYKNMNNKKKNIIISHNPETEKTVREYLNAIPKGKGTGIKKIEPNAICPTCGSKVFCYEIKNLPFLKDEK